MHWIPFAMVRISMLFIAGILVSLADSEKNGLDVATVFLIVFGVAYFLVWLLAKRSHTIKVVIGSLGLAVIFISGYLVVPLRNESLQADHLLQKRDHILAYRAKIKSSIEEKDRSWKLLASAEAILTESGWHPASGKINLYWSKSDTLQIGYGDILLIKSAPHEIEPPYNPGEFDLKSFLAYRNIYHQHFVREGEWIRLEKSHDFGFIAQAHRARHWAAVTLKQFIQSPREQAIVIALILGVTDGLDDELLSAYAASGTMHVLAVSGLHVSIIYGILLFIFKPLGKGPFGQWLIAIVSLTLLWAYAFITGLSPSVLRAVAMFSFVALAKPFGRNTNIYNTLAASAFCILLYDPYLIVSLGFQLSYLAVLGIVYLQRPIYNLWEPKSAWVDWAWQLSCVSIAAQVFTFGLGLLYFHQFPVYFLLSNLFVIPGSTVILVGGILLLLISPLSVVSTWLGTGLTWLVRILNEGVFIVEKMPYSLIEPVNISAIQCTLLFLFVLGLLWLVQFRKFQALYFMATCIIVFSLWSWDRLKSEGKNRWIVYRVKDHSAMEWSVNGHSFFASDSIDSNRIRFHIQPSRLINGINQVHRAETMGSDSNSLRFYRMFGKTFLWIKSKEFQLPEHVSVDYLLLSNNSVKSLGQIEKHIDFAYLVLDASNSTRQCEALMSEAKMMKKPAYSVLKEGAFQVLL